MTEYEKIDTQQYFTEASFNNNHNNISFEDSDSKQMPSIPDNFLPQQINTNDQLPIVNQKLILEKIKQNLLIIIKVIKCKQMFIKLKTFLNLKNFSEIRHVNKLKAELIYNKLISSLRIIYKFYKRKENLNLLRSFIKWKDMSIFIYKINKYKSEYESMLQKKFEKEILVLENRLKEKEKEINEIKNLLNKQIEAEADVYKKIKNYEERELNFLITIKKTEEENKILQSEIMNFQNNHIGNSENQKILEQKVKKLK